MHPRVVFKVMVSLICLMGIVLTIVNWTVQEKQYRSHVTFKTFAGLESKVDRNRTSYTRRKGRQQSARQEGRVELAVVACGDRAPETLVMLKSAVALTTTTSFILHIFANMSLHGYILEEVSLKNLPEMKAWPPPYAERTEYRLYNITFPEDQDASWWRSIFWRPCAYQRLFLHSLLTDTDAVIYLDTDTLLLTAADQVWDIFSQFNSTQLLALAPNNENSRGGGWYGRISKIPFMPPRGVNSGVMLMNLTRLRSSNWTAKMVTYSKLYAKSLRLVDQDLINIYLHFHQDQLFWLDCSLNYRTDHCDFRFRDTRSLCKKAESDGVRILHGNRRAFFNHRTMRGVYTAFAEYSLGDDLVTGLLHKLRHNIRQQTSACAMSYDALLKHLTQVVNQVHSYNLHGIHTQSHEGSEGP